ncbi:MAG: sensor histidine kinase [Burkholderiaceae bacterium]
MKTPKTSGVGPDQWINAVVIAASLLLTCFVFYTLSKEEHYRQRLSDTKSQGMLKSMASAHGARLHERQTILRLAASTLGRTEKILVVQSPGLLVATVEVSYDASSWEPVAEQSSYGPFYLFSPPKEFPIKVPTYGGAHFRVSTASYDLSLPQVNLYEATEYARQEVITRGLELMLFFIPSLLLLIIWAYGGIESIQLKLWLSASMVLSIGLLCGSFEQVHLKVLSLGSVALAQALIGIVALSIVAFTNIARMVCHGCQVKRRLNRLSLLELAVMLMLLGVAHIGTNHAIIALTAASAIFNAAIFVFVQPETFFSAWASGIRVLAALKCMAALVALGCISFVHPPWVDVYGPLASTSISILGLFYLQFNHRTLKDKLAITYAQRQRELNTIRFTEAGVRLRETLRGYRHDLRQPLQSLTLMLGLESHLSQNPASSSRTQKMIASQKSLTAMLDDFFHTMEHELEGKNDTAAPMLALDEVIGPLVAEYGQVAGNKSLYVRYGGTRVRVAVQAEPLRRLIRNIIDNAVKYTQTGGVLIGVRWKKRHWQLWIQDSGPGISSQADKQHKGWGYGSVLMKKLAKRTGVRVLLQEMKRPDQSVSGTRVIIEIPKPAASSLEPTDLLNRATVIAGQRYIIILANPEVRTTSLREHLKTLQIPFIQIRNVARALSHVRSTGLPAGLIAVVTSDWNQQLEEWEFQLTRQAGIPLPTLWVDERSVADKAAFPLPAGANEMDMQDAEISNTAFILADHFGFGTASAQNDQHDLEPTEDLPAKPIQSPEISAIV